MSNDVPQADKIRTDTPSRGPVTPERTSPETVRSGSHPSSPELSSSPTFAATGVAPSCPPELPTASSAPPVDEPHVLRPNERIGDFEVLDVLGRGAFGVVYLAKQLSLDRQVALKVTTSLGSEGRKMAQLEHEHIVQVFSETVDAAGRQQLLCMQYVPGPTLQAVLEELHAADPATWSGAALLAVIDRLTRRPASFDPAAMRNRELLRGCDWIETVCWIGARLAEALDYAHTQGVIHRDIKPGNIMVSQYGRPLLVDFNLAFQPLEAAKDASNPFGGTLSYMAPEHLDAFNPEVQADRESVAEAADIYSLGVVLYQMLTGQLPFRKGPTGSMGEILRAMAAQRRSDPPPLPSRCPRVLDQIISRCLHPEPRQRYGSGRELSAALEGYRRFHAAQKARPSSGRFRRIVLRHPFLWLLLLAFVPHFVATVINIAYNQIRIISHLTADQQTVFVRLVFSYDMVAYSIGAWLGLRVIVPVYGAWVESRAGRRVDARRIDPARIRSQSWPAWAAGLACLGWLPGGPIFALGLTLFAGTLPWHVSAHLIISFTISGLIALTYSMLFVQWISLCVFYPQLWCDVRDFGDTAAVELSPVPRRLRILQVLSGLIPLMGAALMTGMGPQEFTPAEYQSFRFLVTALICLGMAGFQLALFVTGLLSQSLAALTGPLPEHHHFSSGA